MYNLNNFIFEYRNDYTMHSWFVLLAVILQPKRYGLSWIWYFVIVSLVYCHSWKLIVYDNLVDIEIRSISPYSIRMRENTNRKKHRIWTLFTQWLFKTSENSLNPIQNPVKQLRRRFLRKPLTTFNVWVFSLRYSLPRVNGWRATS